MIAATQTIPMPLREHRQATKRQIERSQTMSRNLQEVAWFYADIREKIDQDVVGHHDAKTMLLVATAYCGHTYLVAAPGTAKSRLIKSLAKHLQISCAILSLTSDHMPSDLTGWQTYDHELVLGPLAEAGIVLLDEWNRTQPYTQSGSLEPMEDGIVRIDNTKVPVPEPG